MEIKAEVQYSLEDLKRLARFGFWKRSKTVALCIFVELCAIFEVLAVILDGWHWRRDFAILIFAGIFFLFPLFMFWFVQIINVKKSYKRFKNLTYLYVFSDERMAVSYKGEKEEGNVTFDYERLFRVHETPENLYLLANRVQAYILPRKAMMGDDFENLCEFLRGKMAAGKYKKVRRG